MTTAHFSRMFGPTFGVLPSGTPAASNHTVDASNEAVAWVFDTRNTQAITHLGFRYGARTGTPPQYIIGLEGGSSTTGFPDGTYKTNGGNCSATFTPPADTSWDGTWQWVALSNSYTPALGERLAITIRYNSGTIDASNNAAFTTNWTNMGATQTFIPYAVRNTGGTWAAQALQPVFGVRSASSRYGSMIVSNFVTRTAATIGHRQALHIVLPSGFGQTLRVIGFRAVASIASSTAAKTPIAKIWNSSSALASKTLDTDQGATSASTAYRVVETYFDTAVDLNFGTDYYIGLEVAETVASGVLIFGSQYSSVDDKATDEGGAYLSLANFNGTSWTDDNTVRPWMELILDDWTEPTSGGSIVIPAAARMIG